MSLEVKATITSATGRGLDVDFRKEDFTGFRTSANTIDFQWSAPLTSSYILNFSSSQEQTIRYAIEGTKVHIYQNGTYIDSKDLTSIYNIENGQEKTNPDISNLTSGPNITENAFGNLSTQTPYDAGWSNNGAGAVPWNTPNSGSGVRYINSLNNQLTYNGSTYTENTYFMMMRWESGVTNGSAYYYPVTLETNTTYNLNFLHTYWGNGTSGTFNVAVSQENTCQNIIAETNSTFATNDNKKLIYKAYPLPLLLQGPTIFYLKITEKVFGLQET
ncbi:hypothetical protein QVZ41_10810 [Wenyingzhuangia sp. chi5]|uniref:Uncharacterized protein n=1 Tax=Wenyingzhuangia gilva TaxID=3057677 RepID=A0ABT8VTM6_9FLAO|nr:hypothetical protein [Wenyingzhuangia sp. chi5]MDO3695329.1 hypothetical protein [Wenyingzhuangia sp. chi5]